MYKPFTTLHSSLTIDLYQLGNRCWIAGFRRVEKWDAGWFILRISHDNLARSLIPNYLRQVEPGSGRRPEGGLGGKDQHQLVPQCTPKLQIVPFVCPSCSPKLGRPKSTPMYPEFGKSTLRVSLMYPEVRAPSRGIFAKTCLIGCSFWLFERLNGPGWAISSRAGGFITHPIEGASATLSTRGQQSKQ